jgi:hypothetical protein
MDVDDGSRGSSAGGGGGRSSGAAASAMVEGRGDGFPVMHQRAHADAKENSNSQRTAPGGEMVMLVMW